MIHGADYILNNYPFVSKIFETIMMGSSQTNTKIIKLDKIYPKDTFTYIFSKELSITRTDETFDCGQDLIGYLKFCKCIYKLKYSRRFKCSKV